MSARLLAPRLAVAVGLAMAFSSVPALAVEAPTPYSVSQVPDARVYELVTPLEYYGEEVNEPTGGEFTTNLTTSAPFQASASGSRVAYAASPTAGGNESAGYYAGNEYVAERTGEGTWTQTNISAPGAPSAVYQGFSTDLSVGFLDSTEPLGPGAPGFGESIPLSVGNYDIPYTTDMTGAYTPLITVRPPYRSAAEFATHPIFHQGFDNKTGNRAFNGRILEYAGASDDSSHVLLEADDALTPEAEGGVESSFSGENNLYEYVGGGLRLVNILPDGTTKANASFGGVQPESSSVPNFSGAISSDGSRIFWTDLSTGAIYVRENGVRTVEVSPAGTYGTASADGSKVFYTDGDLYQYDVETAQTTDLTPGVEVAGLVGASEDGTYLYYVTSTFDLEVLHGGVSKEVQALSPADSEVWATSPAFRLAEVTPDGHSLVYMDKASEEQRIRVYDADTEALYCASCSNGGSNVELPSSLTDYTYKKRWIADDGSRVFFDSYSALVPQDANGKLDAYEWERPGSGDCTAAGGCLYLLSAGTSSSESYVLDASADGDDVFIVTRAHLLAKDTDEAFSVYDDRVNGFTATTPPACTGSGCQGLPGVPPIFATPSSVTFQGVGNFEAPVVKATPKPKKKAKPKKAKRKKGKRKSVKKARKSSHSGGKRG